MKSGRLTILTFRTIEPVNIPAKAPKAWVAWLTSLSQSSDLSLSHQFCIIMTIKRAIVITNLNILQSLGIGRASGGLWICSPLLDLWSRKKLSLWWSTKLLLCQLNINWAKCAATSAYKPPETQKKDQWDPISVYLKSQMNEYIAWGNIYVNLPDAPAKG